jgi:hypothetical protein
MRVSPVIFALLIVAASLWLPPQVKAQSQQKVTLALDNYGGYSHGGRRVRVFADNSYQQVSYTDVVGDQKVRRGKCSLDLKAGKMHLDSDKKAGERLFRVSYDDKEYWVHEDELVRLKEPGENRLRQTSLRNKR